MIRVHPDKIKDPEIKDYKLGNFIRGLNKLVSSTQIRGTELSDAVDIQLIEDGKVMCPRMGQAYLGTRSGTRVTGLTGYYKADGTRQLIRMCGENLQRYNAGNWDNITGFTYSSLYDSPSLSPSESNSSSASASLSPSSSESSSASASLSPSSSNSSSVSASLSPSSSESSSVSASLSPSSSDSPSVSASLSPSSSDSPSDSASLSPSSSESSSESASDSSSVSSSESESASVSPSSSGSASDSASLSPSSSESASISPSSSGSASLSPSSSASSSESASLSPSASTSPSPADDYSLDTDMVTAYDNLYICNGIDVLTKYDGSTISSFTAVSSPTISSVTRTGGAAGSYTFSYKVTSVSENGESMPSAASTSTLDQADLSSTIYMTVAWSAVTGAVGYNVYGNKDGQWYFMSYLEGNSSTSYIDNGNDTPQSVFPAPEADTTQGPIGKYITLYNDTLFIFGDPDNPSRLYYSGGGDKVDDFSVSNGGGFIDVAKNDGTVGTGMIPYRNSLIVFKEDSLYKFDFETTGLPSMSIINPAVGAISRRSIIVVENDVYFASRRGIFTVGNEPGFAFDVLRTNEISARVRPLFKMINSSYMSRIAAIYATADNYNLAIFAYADADSTSNTKALVFDRERLAWYEWSNIQASCWTQYNDTVQGGDTKVLYGHDTDGYVCQILTGSDDFGTGIHGYFSTKAVDFGYLNGYKNLKDVDVIIRNPSGTISVDIVTDGTTTQRTADISSVYPTVNWGHYVLTEFLLGESYGVGTVDTQRSVLKTLRNNNIEGRSFMLTFDNNSAASFVLLEANMTSKPRSLRYRHSEDIISY